MPFGGSQKIQHSSFLASPAVPVVMLCGYSNVAVAASGQDIYSPAIIFFIVFLLVFVLALVFYRKSARYVLHNTYGQIKLDTENQQLLLFKRHHKKACKYLPLSDIRQCSLQLNQQTIAMVGLHSEQAFDQAQEAYLRQLLRRAYQEKLVDRQVRMLILHVSTGVLDHQVCLYMRRGSRRLTRTSYQQVVDDVINFLSYISVHLHPEEPSAPKAKLDGQATSEQPSAFAHDLELVDAMEKLAIMQQQGTLSEQEFQAAKSKLLKDLMVDSK